MRFVCPLAKELKMRASVTKLQIAEAFYQCAAVA
jgi:hypothetical protein